MSTANGSSSTTTTTRRVKHLNWQVQVNFEAKVLSCQATWLLQEEEDNDKKDNQEKILVLDTAHLLLESVHDQDGQALPYHLAEGDPTKPHIGQPLRITLSSSPSSSSSAASTKNHTTPTTAVTIRYQTTAQSSALQWLPPAQTAGQVYPYLFTQCQAIHARSLVPCQDQPGYKFTYAATVQVPSWATCVMSAVLEFSLPDTAPPDRETTTSNGTREFVWQQLRPISSYLLALAVGQLERRDLSDRCAIWSEPSLIEAAAQEFVQTETFLQVAEALADRPYPWGRYDLLLLPPSFPYGGMENPCLTFVTPTLLAGDGSLVDVIAHEIAHSWTGNWVTNATWDHFWLNEGWTTWFQRRIMARVHQQEAFFHLDALSGDQLLRRALAQLPEPYTRLVLALSDDQDPDDAYSHVAYEKGFQFLTYLEQWAGSMSFLDFFRAYLAHFSQQPPLTSSNFQEFFVQYFQRRPEPKRDLSVIDWERWLYVPGPPPVKLEWDRSLATAAETLAREWREWDPAQADATVPTAEISTWTSQQICCFLDALAASESLSPGQQEPPAPALSLAALKKMDDQYHLAESRNCEILFRYCHLALNCGDVEIIPTVVRFITTQGRMKYVRPLYQGLAGMDRSLAVRTFVDHANFYHPICSKMVASDLMVQWGSSEPLDEDQKKTGVTGKFSFATTLGLLSFSMTVAAAGLILAALLLRRRR